ncbi:voltage-dependent calcium channel type A subunit alpha-1-like [Ixodes scapularis]|uniref:voltage-dependent calcium channel type A subunit alpha-1-like n=1 Tax=Ixodes scapularis TaxID=6945 RepID=UPI001A9FECC8|nr:voltage-dependent calcium channel type A subunit alpha-1-like [Ixodes scapularis]
MIGVAGSRHLARGRRGSSPSLSPLPGGPRRFSLSPLPQEEHAASAPESPASRASPVASVSPAGPDAASPERKLPAGVMLGRRRAVTTTDHKTCALLHTRLKGLRLEDIA